MLKGITPTRGKSQVASKPDKNRRSDCSAMGYSKKSVETKNYATHHLQQWTLKVCGNKELRHPSPPAMNIHFSKTGSQALRGGVCLPCLFHDLTITKICVPRPSTRASIARTVRWSDDQGERRRPWRESPWHDELWTVAWNLKES